MFPYFCVLKLNEMTSAQLKLIFFLFAGEDDIVDIETRDDDENIIIENSVMENLPQQILTLPPSHVDFRQQQRVQRSVDMPPNITSEPGKITFCKF
jgi:hypothetical protein